MRRDVGFFLVFIYMYFWGLVVLIDFALAGRTGIDLLVQHSQLRDSLKSVYVVCSRKFLYAHSIKHTEHAAPFVLH
jgi:hypothetical protein